MSSEEFDISQSMAAELTGSVGVPEAVDSGDELPESMANAVEEFDQHQAEKDIPVSNDVDDTREAAEQRDIEQEQQRGRNKKVPLAALHEERTKRQALELQLAAYQQQMQQLQAQQQVAQQAQLQAQQEAEIPPFSEDPEGHVEAVKRQFKQEIENLKNGGQQPQIQQAAQLQQVIDRESAVLMPVVVEAEQRFLQEHPDYGDALSHVQRIVDAQLRSRWPSATAEQLQLAHRAELVGHVKNCQARGIDPCAAIYASAQGLGYKAASSAPRKQPPTSLSNLSGSARAPDERGAVTASDISEMSEAEFDKFWSQMKGGGSQGPAF